MNFSDFETQKEVGIQLHRLKVLYSTGFIQVPQNFKGSPFYQSVVIEVLILLDDLLQKIKDVDRISFTEDIPQDVNLYGDKKYDITNYIRYFRNAVCHINNDKRKVGSVTISFGMCVGYAPNMFVIGTKKIGGKYTDDACLVMGDKTLYIKRHLIRVYEELKQSYSRLANSSTLLFPLKHFLD